MTKKQPITLIQKQLSLQSLHNCNKIYYITHIVFTIIVFLGKLFLKPVYFSHFCNNIFDYNNFPPLL